MSRGRIVRYTVRVAQYLDMTSYTLHGVFFTEDQARAKAEQWQRVLDKRFGPRRVVVSWVPLHSDSAEDRDRYWMEAV